MATYRPAQSLKGRTFQLLVFNRLVFNFCVRSAPLRGAKVKPSIALQKMLIYQFVVRLGSWDRLLVAGEAGEYLPQSSLCVLTLIRCPFHPLVLPQWHVKDPGHCAKSAGVRLHLNAYTPSTQRSRNGQTMPLSRHSVGTF